MELVLNFVYKMGDRGTPVPCMAQRCFVPMSLYSNPMQMVFQADLVESQRLLKLESKQNNQKDIFEKGGRKVLLIGRGIFSLCSKKEDDL